MSTKFDYTLNDNVVENFAKKKAQIMEKEHVSEGFDNSHTNKYTLEEQQFENSRIDEAEIIRYIFNNHKDKITDCGINTDTIYACTKNNWNYKYHRSVAITIKNNKLYMNNMSVDILDIQTIM